MAQNKMRDPDPKLAVLLRGAEREERPGNEGNEVDVKKKRSRGPERHERPLYSRSKRNANGGPKDACGETERAHAVRDKKTTSKRRLKGR